ncbi:hypothetical protein NLU13_6814 [Sarocladium strictum]|uniref:Uncharacterized protein n=1 Tax=Sarocladium strictum TaxID=5046 RepID=A0AA39L680_SARSR|nr:hypothetical protein NLU13_6814 [Sarocladium strictum]
MDHTNYSKPIPRRWDPDAVFEITNPSTGYPTCVGQAVTCGRRCKRVVAGYNVLSANCIARDLAELSPSAAAGDDQLYHIAHIMLCYQHGHQAEELVSKWRRELHHCDSKSEAEPPLQTGGFHYEDDIKDLYEAIQKLQEQLRRIKAARQTHSEKSSPFNNPSTEYCSKKSTWGQDDSETKTEETDETREDLREKQKREAKERADKAKEEARRSAQAAKLAEQLKWSNAWSLYNAAWENIELGRSRTSPRAPWPTLSGKAEDVSEASVREFFQRAPGKDTIDLVTRVIVQRWKEAKGSRAK